METVAGMSAEQRARLLQEIAIVDARMRNRDEDIERLREENIADKARRDEMQQVFDALANIEDAKAKAQSQYEALGFADANDHQVKIRNRTPVKPTVLRLLRTNSDGLSQEQIFAQCSNLRKTSIRAFLSVARRDGLISLDAKGGVYTLTP